MIAGPLALPVLKDLAVDMGPVIAKIAGICPDRTGNSRKRGYRGDKTAPGLHRSVSAAFRLPGAPGDGVRRADGDPPEMRLARPQGFRRRITDVKKGSTARPASAAWSLPETRYPGQSHRKPGNRRPGAG